MISRWRKVRLVQRLIIWIIVILILPVLGTGYFLWITGYLAVAMNHANMRPQLAGRHNVNSKNSEFALQASINGHAVPRETFLIFANRPRQAGECKSTGEMM